LRLYASNVSIGVEGAPGMLSWRASKRVTILGMIGPGDGEFIARAYPVGRDEQVGAVDERLP
jgi:hypothetical protein